MEHSLAKNLNARQLLSPKAMLFGVCILYFLVRLMFVLKIELERQAERAAGTGNPYSDHWNPVAVLAEPFLLLVAVIGLLVNRWWTFALSLVASVRVAYSSGYLPWVSVHNAHDVPMFSRQAMEKLWYVVYQPRPEYLIEVILATVLFIYALSLMSGFVHARARFQNTGG